LSGTRAPPPTVIARQRVGASRDPLARNAGKLMSGFPPMAQHRPINYLPRCKRRILI